MIGSKKLSAIREELRAALVAEGVNPIASLDRRIRNAKKNPSSAQREFRSLTLLRNTLARLVEETEHQPPSPPRPRRKRAI